MNVHLIPTDNPSRLGRIVATNNLFLKVQNDLPRGENVHVYITVDDTIKIEIIDNECRKLKFTKNETRIGKKVILTDNPTLIDSGVQAIPNDFLEWLVQNPSCEEVEIEKEHDDTVPYPKMRYVEPYKIVLPKEEPKQTDEKGNPLTYWGGLKEPKQETIPVIGKTYHYFDDGKIKLSRRGKVVITEVIPFENIDEETLILWKEAVEECDWLYAPETDFFVKVDTFFDITFVRTKDDNWFSFGFLAGRLDIDGSLNEALNKEQ